MSKLCKNCGKYPVFSKGYCKYCQYKNYTSIKEKQGSKYTKKKDKVIKNGNFGFNTQMEMFKYIWNTQPHTCWLTGLALKEFDVRMFAHVLRKGTYTYFKLNPKNIRLLHPTIHNLVDNFKEELREQYSHVDFNKWFKLQEEMKIKYEEFKRKNLLA